MAITAMALVHMYDGRGGSNKTRTHAWWKKKKKKKSQYVCPLDHSPVWHEETEGEGDRSTRERVIGLFSPPSSSAIDEGQEPACYSNSRRT